MDKEEWLQNQVNCAKTSAVALRTRIAADCSGQEELDRLAILDETERQSVLMKAEEFLEKEFRQINQLADDLEKLADSPVERPTHMTAEIFLHPANIAPRLIYRPQKWENQATYAYYFNWNIHFYETKVRLCLTISDKEEPLFVSAKDLVPESLHRIHTTDFELVKRRISRNIWRHVYLNTLYQAGVF